MDPESINTFLLRQNIPIEISGNDDSHPMQSSIDEVLKNWPANDVDVLLATNLEHLNHVERLVHALAVYEKEEDAVHIKKEHYFVDGGFVDSNQPLYKCLLLRGKSKDEYFGLALFYFGFDVERGPYLYLEDLYIDEAFRGRGSGTLIMTTLALIARKTLCTGFVWQALDWNTLALTFYDNLGATVIDNLLTSRLCGEQIKEFLHSHP
jgi:GNAT superfamily N-acetyltransferase